MRLSTYISPLYHIVLLKGYLFSISQLIFFLEIMSPLKLSSFITCIFFQYMLSFTASLLRAVDLIDLFLFSEENLKLEEQNLAQFSSSCHRRKMRDYHSYQLYCIKPFQECIQSLAESLWQILNGTVDFTFEGKFNLIMQYSEVEDPITCGHLQHFNFFYYDSTSTACLITQVLFQILIDFCLETFRVFY